MPRRAELIAIMAKSGKTVDELAAAAGVSRSTLFRWRRGETVNPNPRELDAVAMVLHVEPGELRALIVRGLARGRRLYHDAAGEEEDARRREAVTGGVAAATELVVGGPLWPASVMPLLGKDQKGSPRSIDSGVVDHLASMRAVLVRSDNRLGPAWVLPTVRLQLAMIPQLRRRARGELRTQLLSAEARWAEFAGWLSDDLGDHEAGAWWLSQSMSMAQEAKDLDFSAYLFARMAQRAAGSEDQDRVPGLAYAAARVGTIHPRVQAFATLQRASGYAFVGEIHQFESAIENARSLVEQKAAPLDDLGSFCTVPYVLAEEAEGWLRLGRPKVAAQRFCDAMALWPATYRRDRGLYLTRAAAAHLADQEPEEAARLALEALELAGDTHSARVRSQLVALGSHLAKYEEQPSIARLLAALAASPPAGS